MVKIHPAEQRRYRRYFPNKDIYIKTQGVPFKGQAVVSNMSLGGVGAVGGDIGEDIVGNTILLDLIIDHKCVFMRSLTMQIIHNCSDEDKNSMQKSQSKFGMRFTHLTGIQKKMLHRFLNNEKLCCQESLSQRYDIVVSAGTNLMCL